MHTLKKKEYLLLKNEKIKCRFEKIKIDRVEVDEEKIVTEFLAEIEKMQNSEE